MQSTATVAPNAHLGHVPKCSTLTDEQLLAELKAGQDDALAVLFDRYHRLVYSISLRIVRDPAEAEDVMQNVFFEVYRSVARFDSSKGTCKGWLLQYAYHRAINRKQHLTANHFYDPAGIEEADFRSYKRQSSFMRFTQPELELLMEEGLSSLNPMQRRVIDLATYKGLSMQEISTCTSESLVNVRHHYYRGLKRLRLFIGEAGCSRSSGNA